MKNLFLILVCFSCYIIGKSQSKEDSTINYFQRKQEQMDKRVRTVFDERYKKRKFKKYKGLIIQTDSSTLKIGSRLVIIKDSPSSYFKIFSSGLIPPDTYLGRLFKSDEDPATWPIPFNMFTNGPVIISQIREVGFENLEPNIKRFRFVLFPYKIDEGQLITFELNCTSCNDHASIEQFIDKAKLKFYSVVGIY